MNRSVLTCKVKIKIGLPQCIVIKTEVMHSKFLAQRLARCSAVVIVIEHPSDMRLEVRVESN